MPVGRIIYKYLGPMTFYEFLEALGEKIVLEQIKNIKTSHNQQLHEKATELLKLFYYIGGMFEAVKVYIKTKDFLKVKQVHSSIINTYKDDIPKYTKNDNSVDLIYNFLPNNIGKKVMYTKISQTVNTEKLKTAIKLLSSANIIQRTISNSASGTPLSANMNEKTQKLYFLDVGLYNYLNETEWKDIFKANACSTTIRIEP